MNAKEFFSVPENVNKYHEWLDNHITKIIVDILRQEARFPMPIDNTIRAETALVRAGKTDGWHECIDRMTNMESQAKEIPEEPVADFGALDRIKETLGPKAAESIKKKLAELNQ